MPCVFCGSTEKLTREHVFPQWLRDVIPGKGRITHEWIAPKGSDSESRVWTSELLTLTAKVVCEECNTGWMHNLEERARPFLEPMIRGRKATLYDEGRELVACWALKTAMMTDIAQEPEHRCVPAADYPALYAAQGVPPDAFVWIGATDFGPGAHARHRTLDLDVGDAHFEGFGATLAFGHLVTEVIRVEVEEGKTLYIGGKLAPALRRLWPHDEPLAWPQGVALTRQGVVRLPEIIRVNSIALRG